ncbi:dolichyl-diphosphooligosaccharide--protein glycosyltransferase subunit Wbp1p [Monosporozyma unispora]|nr:oligosaccharyl transferase glycoprotein complex, beta subunit [Kazachstania unispora]
MLLNNVCLLLGVISTWFTIVRGLSLTGDRTLIIYDSKYINRFYSNNNSNLDLDEEDDSVIDSEKIFEEKFSQFLCLLESNDYNYKLYDINNGEDEDLQIIKVDDSLYDNVIIFPISKTSLKSGSTPSKGKLLLSSKNLLSFFNDYNGNLMIVTSPDINNAESLTYSLNQFGIYPAPKNQVVRDYFQDNNEKLLVPSSNLLNKYVYTVEGKDTIFNLGNSSIAKLDNRAQLVPILKASKTSFIPSNSQEKKFEPWVVGSQGYLISGFQGVNNNARLIWLGSSDLLCNCNNKVNQDLIENLINWNFNAKSVIKSLNSRHYHSDSKLSYNALNYKVNDLINYEIDITEWDGSKWIPFISNDIQFELRQVDPYYRINLTHKTNVGNKTFAIYTTNDFKLPNRHGMFKFITEYERNGLSSIKDEDIKAIRHLANDEYPRSWEITNDWVYLAANAVVIVSFIAFVILFLTNTNVTPLKKNN